MIHLILALEVLLDSNKHQLILNLHNETLITKIKQNLQVLIGNEEQDGF